MDELVFSNKTSGSPSLFTCADDHGWCAFLLVSGGIGPTDGEIKLSAIPSYTGYLLFATAAPTINVSTFIQNVYSFAGPLITFQTGALIWLTSPDNALSTSNALQLILSASGTGYSVLQPLNYNFGNNYATLFISNNGINISIDPASNTLSITGQLGQGNFTFGSNNLRSSSQVLSNLELPMTGGGRGRIRFSLGLNCATDFICYDISSKYFFNDQQNGNQFTEFSYPIVIPGNLNQLALLQASVYPCDLLNKTGTNTYFAFTGETLNTDTGKKSLTVLLSYYLTGFGYPVQLIPNISFTSNGNSINYPVANSGLLMLSERVAGSTSNSWYMVFQGALSLTLDNKYQNNTDSKGQLQLMCGLASTESISFTPQFIDSTQQITGQGDWLFYQPNQNAFAAQFPVTPTQNMVGSNTAQQWPTAAALTAWCSVVKSDQTNPAIVYHAQPQGSSLYSPTSDAGSALFNHFSTGAGVLSQSSTAIFFPMVPYGNPASTSATQKDFGLMEKQVLNPCRKTTIAKTVKAEKLALSPALYTNALLAAGNATSNGISSTSPQGFYVNVDQQAGLWNVLQLASNQFLTSTGKPSKVFNLQFTPAGAEVQSALQSHQLFLVISYNKKLEDGSYVLANFQNEMEIEEWPFNLDVPSASVNGMYNNVIIFKFCHGKLIDKVQNIQGWNMPDTFNDVSSNGLPNVSMWLQQYIQKGIDKYKVQGDTDYYKFYNVATQEDWQGVIALGVDISVQDFPPELQGLLAGIDLNNFYAHHFGIDISIVNNTGGSVTMQPTSSLFALIDYEDQTFTALGSSPEAYQKQAPINTTVDYDFTVLKLKVGFANSKIYNYNSYLALAVNKLFGEQIDSTNRNNLLILTGTYENHNGVPSYTFTNTGDSVLIPVNNATLLDIEIIKASFVTKVSQDSVNDNNVHAQFSFWGFMNFVNQPGFDLLSFGSEQSSLPPNFQGLSYASLYIDLSFPLAFPTTKTFVFDISHMAFDIGQSTPRKDSLYAHFPLQLAGITAGDDDNSPSSQGYLDISVSSPNGGVQTTSISGDWYALVFNLNMGTLGALASSAGFNTQFMMAWQVGGRGAWAGLKLPGVNPQAPSFSLQGVLKLDIGSITLVKASNPASAGTAYLLKINNIALKLFSLSFPPGGNISFMLFGNPSVAAQPESLGWYGAYVKS